MTQDKLELAYQAIEELSEQVAVLPIGDPGYEKGMLLISESRYSLSAAITSLAMKKAKVGIVGNSWYKPSEEPEA